MEKMNKEDWLKFEWMLNNANSKELVVIREMVDKEIGLAKEVIDEEMRKEEYYTSRSGDVITEKEILDSGVVLPKLKKISKKEYLKRRLLEGLK